MIVPLAIDRTNAEWPLVEKLYVETKIAHLNGPRRNAALGG
jgi:hypothetical protein